MIITAHHTIAQNTQAPCTKLDVHQLQLKNTIEHVYNHKNLIIMTYKSSNIKTKNNQT